MSPAAGWLVAAIVFGIVEVLTTGFWFLWLALSALMVSLLTKLHLLPSLSSQVLVFTVITVVLIVFTRPLVMKFVQFKEVKSNVDALIGVTGVVVQDIFPYQTGQVKILGEIWTAKSDQEILKDTKIVVRSIEGVTLTVEPLNY